MQQDTSDIPGSLGAYTSLERKLNREQMKENLFHRLFVLAILFDYNMKYWQTAMSKNAAHLYVIRMFQSWLGVRSC